MYSSPTRFAKKFLRLSRTLRVVGSLRGVDPARHTSSPQSDPWWVSRRQLNQLAGPSERRRCTPPGGFSLMPGATAGELRTGSDGVVTVGKDRPVGKSGVDTTSLQALQGARLHSLPGRGGRPQGRG